MSDPLEDHSTEPVEEYPYISLTTWLETGSLLERYIAGEVYIASHVWTSEEHKVETFVRSVVGDEAQMKLSEFLRRSPGNWTDTPETRKARWIEIVGHFDIEGIEGKRSPYIETLLNYLKLPYAVFDEPHADDETNEYRLLFQSLGRVSLGRVSLLDERGGLKGVIEHGHLTHFFFDCVRRAKIHIFLLNNNDIVTIYDGGTNDLERGFLGRLHGGPPFVPPQGKVNAAAVLWRVLTLAVEAVGNNAIPNQPGTTRYNASLDLDQLLLMRSVRPLEDAGPILLDSICTRMVDRQATTKDWMEDDITADFQQLSHYCKRMLRHETNWYRSLDILIERKQSEIAEKQAHSAVILNRLWRSSPPVLLFAFRSQ